MEDPNHLSLARKLISENKKSKSDFLDLGNCGISDLNELPELFECIWLKRLNLGWGYYDGPIWILSNPNNKGEDNQIVNFPSNVSYLRNLERLDMRRQKLNLRSLNYEIHFPKLINLDLSENGIDDGGIHVITIKFPKLESLFLALNNISDDGALKISLNLKNLKQLSLWANKISDKGATVLANNLTTLSELYLAKNRITLSGIEEMILKLRSLIKVDFSQNKVAEFRDEVLKDINELNKHVANKYPLDYAQQIIIENKRTKSKIMDLGNLGISDLNDIPTLFDCEWIERLNLGKFYYQNYNLNSLTESKNNGITNKLEKIPEKITKLRNLKHLELSHQKIKNAGLQSIILFLPELLSLNLYGNLLKPREILLFSEGISKLQFLNLGQTNLHGDLSPITENLSELVSLDVSNNKIDDDAVKAISKGLRKLQYLDLSNCPFSLFAIDDISENLIELRSLNLSDTATVKIKPLIHLPNLVDLKINNCPIRDCPTDVWQTNDISVIRSYFGQMDEEREIKKSLKGGTKVTSTKSGPSVVRKRDVKLVLLGNSNAGKTTLVKFLTSGEFNTTRKSTHGMEVIRWAPDEKRFPLLKDVTVSIWDFGGQDYYHESYKVFLSSNALFLVLWCRDSDKDFYKKEVLDDKVNEIEELAHFEKSYWLNTVRYYSGFSNKNSPTALSPLFLLQTKTDVKYTDGNESNTDINLIDGKESNQPKTWLDDRERVGEKLHDEFEITESFSLGLKKAIEEQDPKEKRQLDYFIKELEYELKKLSGETDMPETWLKVRQEIWDIGTNVKNLFHQKLNGGASISLEDFFDICTKITDGKLKREDSLKLPKVLSSGGTLIHFENIQKLKNRVFLNPGKLSSEIYERFNNEVRSNNGELTFKAEDENAPIIKELLIDLGLIMPHPNSVLKEKFIVPQYLPDKHPVEYLFKIAPKETWKASLWFKVPMFYYKRVLNHLLFHFAAYTGPDTPAFFWKHAIIFVMDNHRIMIKGLYPSDSNEGIIQLSVETGNFKSQIEKTIFNEIKSQLKKEHNNYQGENEFYNSNLQEITKFNSKSFTPWLYVSVDGKNFIDFKKLPKNEKDDFDQSELKGASLSAFASLLNFSPEVTKKVFLSYSHQNTYWLNRLRVHLTGLKHSKLIEEWTDQEILPGEKWDNRIKEQIEKADLFILLLSADFVASRYIWGVELPKIKEKIKSHGGQLIFVLTEPFDFGAISEISEIELIPKDDKKNNKLTAVSLWTNQEEALEKVAIDIRQLIEKK